MPAPRPKNQPTAERLAQRAKERWEKIAKADWIEAYDFLTAEQKQAMPLAQYLSGKQNFEYANPVVKEVLKVEGDHGYVRVSTRWTPHHPQFKKVKLEPGQTLTQEIELIETWNFSDGDWLYLRPQREEEFFAEHSELLKPEHSEILKNDPPLAPAK